MDLTVDDLESPPLPDGPLAVAWHAYLASWAAGLRQEAIAAVGDFVDLLDDAGEGISSTFAEWLCVLLFDRSEFWVGQWGGGAIFRDGVWQRPVAPALTAHALSTRVVLPYLLAGVAADESPHLRWLYQFSSGQGYRLPPLEQQRLRSAIEERCGVGAEPIELLRRATGDPVARRMLHDAEGD